jgi:hypothetical protein
MQEEENPIRSEEEKLAAEMPDPAGPPQPERTGHPVLATIGMLGLGTVAVGLIFPLLTGTTATAGATRSARIRWESRVREIDEAIKQDEHNQQPDPAQPVVEDPTDG